MTALIPADTVVVWAPTRWGQKWFWPVALGQKCFWPVAAGAIVIFGTFLTFAPLRNGL